MAGGVIERIRSLRQIKALENQVRFVIPDRSGYGRSTRLPGQMPVDFHQRAAEETLLVLDALGIKRAIFWGHSDGAVIAAKIGLLAPQRCERLLLEAFHFEPAKPNSRRFFQQFATHPEEVNEKMQRLLIADHGKDKDQWKKVVQRNCQVWLKLATESKRPDDDLFDRRLKKLKVPVTFMHGRGDPRTEPGELARALEAMPHAEVRFVETGRHSPHSERKSWQECNEILGEFLARKQFSSSLRQKTPAFLEAQQDEPAAAAGAAKMQPTAQQAAEKLRFDIRVCLQAYRKDCIINRAFRRCHPKTTFSAAWQPVVRQHRPLTSPQGAKETVKPEARTAFPEPFPSITRCQPSQR